MQYLFAGLLIIMLCIVAVSRHTIRRLQIDLRREHKRHTETLAALWHTKADLQTAQNLIEELNIDVPPFEDPDFFDETMPAAQPGNEPVYQIENHPTLAVAYNTLEIFSLFHQN